MDCGSRYKIGGAVIKSVQKFEYDTEIQLHFHLLAMLFWGINLVAGTACIILAPRAWTSVGVYYVFVLSIYANWDTDFGAVTAALAARKAGEK